MFQHFVFDSYIFHPTNMLDYNNNQHSGEGDDDKDSNWCPRQMPNIGLYPSKDLIFLTAYLAKSFYEGQTGKKLKNTKAYYNSHN